MTSEALVQGSVIEFDSHVGLGRVRLDSGESVFFHCAEIVDGSRQIAIGQKVACVIRQKFDRDEAFDLRPV